MDQRHSPKVNTTGVRPVMTMAGIMPGGSEMRHWHDRVPFPNPDAIAREMAAGRARTQAEIARQDQLTSSPRRHMALGTCVRPAGACMYEYACSRCPFLLVDESSLGVLLELEADTQVALAKAQDAGWDGEVIALTDTLVRIAGKRSQAELAVQAIR